MVFCPQEDGHVAASEAATKQMDGYGYSLSYIY